MYSSLTYGTVIKELRNDRFLSQGELAEDICSQGMLSRIENNDVVPNVLVMQQLCQKLNVSVNYVLTLEEGPERQRNNWLELLKQLEQSKDFHQLAETIVKVEEEAHVFTTKAEKQEFGYYKGCSLHHDNHGLEGALKVLQEALNLTYYRNKQDVTDFEVLLLSQIGKVYYDLGKFEHGITFMKRSASQFYSNMASRERVELINVFYNLACALIDLKCYDEATEYVEQGILWSQKKKTYYSLADLYYLKGIILEAHNDLGGADEVVQIAMTLENMAKQANGFS